MTSHGARGRVVLVGAGPGDPDLITVRGAQALAEADVVLFDELAAPELLALASPRAELVNVGKRGHDAPTRGQSEITELMLDHARAGKNVVRLKGGDPFVFGRGGEEASACVAAGIPWEVVPGVSASVAALSYAGIPITDRRHSASFAVVTGHKDPTRVSEETRWRELGTAVDTLVILMGTRNLPQLAAMLIEGGKAPDTPAAAIMNGTLPEQRVVEAPLAELADAVEAAGLRAPAAIVVGPVVALRKELAWWERVPLFGLRVLVTRAAHQALELASALRAEGAAPVLRPMIELAAPDSADETAAIVRAVRELGEYDAIVFNSSNAARFFTEAVHRHGAAEGLSGLRAQTICIGQATAEAVLHAGMPVHLVASGRGDAEGLLAEMLQTLPRRDQRILIPRSDIGRTVIADGLREAGAKVDSITFYRNRRPEVDREGLLAELTSGALSVLTFTSPSTVEGFVDLLDAPAREAASACIIAAIGTTTARKLEAVGLPAQVVPERPEVRAMVEALADYVASRPGRTK